MLIKAIVVIENGNLKAFKYHRSNNHSLEKFMLDSLEELGLTCQKTEDLTLQKGVYDFLIDTSLIP